MLWARFEVESRGDVLGSLRARALALWSWRGRSDCLCAVDITRTASDNAAVNYGIRYVAALTVHVVDGINWYTANTVATRVTKPKCTPRGYQIRRQPLTALSPLELLIDEIKPSITK